MIVKYDLKGYYDQTALPDEQHTLMDVSVDSVYGVLGTIKNNVIYLLL